MKWFDLVGVWLLTLVVAVVVVLVFVLLTGCGGSSYRCACTEDGHVRVVELSNESRSVIPPAPLPAKAGAELCVATCQANEVPPP